MNSIEDFATARKALEHVVRKTQLIYSDYLSLATGNQVYLKPENLQNTGSYKLRGAYYKISRMTDQQKKNGIITSSAGNHAQGVAYAAKINKAKATIVMPTTTPLVKINNTKKYGAEVVLSGEVYDESYHLALELAEKHGYEFVHPFNDLDIATGQGTIAFEILEDLPKADILLVPIGGGGLASGVSTLAKLLKPDIEVIGVEPRGAACMERSLAHGYVISLDDINTIAEGVAVQTPGDIIFPYIQRNLDGIITIDDCEIPDCFLSLMENHKIVVENAGLLSVAALDHLGCKNKKVVSVLSGGNMDVIAMPSLIQHGLIHRGRVFSFAVQLPDRPGELMRISAILAEENGNVISLDHNQFININRHVAIELRITLEAYGLEHKRAILDRLHSEGYAPEVLPPRSFGH